MPLPTAPRLLVAAVLVTGVAVGAGAVSGSAPGGSGSQTAQRASSTRPAVPVAEVRAAAVLRAWDAARARAWAAGDVRRLGALYTPGSVAGRRDGEMLREWRRRGLVVRDLRTQVLALRQVRRTSATWVLRVTDRVSGGTAVGPRLTRALPRDSATTTTVRLRRLDGRWLVESVSAAGS